MRATVFYFLKLDKQSDTNMADVLGIAKMDLIICT